MAEMLAAAFPDLEEVFSAEEILAFWGEDKVGEGASSGAEAGSSSGAGPSPP